MSHAPRVPLLAPTLSLIVLALTALGAPARAEEWTYEAFPPALASKDLPAELRSGTGWSVREAGRTEAFLTTWELESAYGLFTCPSTRMLQVRIHEVTVMATVVGSNAGDEFLQGLQGRLAALPGAAVALVEDPLGTLEGSLDGAKQTFGRIEGLFSKRKATKYEDGGVDGLLFAGEKRKVAAELRVDVYSSNKKLQAFLEELAKARRAGQFGVDLAKMAVTGPWGNVVTGLTWTGDLTALLRDKTPAELDQIAEAKFEQAGVMPNIRRAFFDDPYLSPRHRTSISEAVARLQGVGNLGALVAAAAESRTEAQAFMHEDQALHLVEYHQTVEPLARLDVTGGIVAAFTQSGKLFVPVPVDVLALVPQLPAAIQAIMAMPGAAQAPARALRFRGTPTPEALRYLKAGDFGFLPLP